MIARPLLRLIAAAAFLSLVAFGGARPAAACSGPLAPVADTIASAGAIALVRVVALSDPDPYVADRELEVEEVFKGGMPARVRVPPLAYHACGDVIDAAVGTRLVISFDARPFAQGSRMNPFWRVSADGGLVPDGIDDEGAGWSTVAELRAGLLARLGAPGRLVPDPAPAATPPAPSIVPTLALVVSLASGVFVLAGLVARRSSRRGRQADTER